MRRYGSPVRCGFWHGMSRYGTPEVVRFVSLCSGPCFALGRLHCPAAAGLRGCAMWRYVAPCRGPEISGGPGRLSSGTAAGSAVSSSHCLRSEGIFSREPGRVPGAGAGIRAGKGSVRAPGVPVRVAVGVPGALSHIFSESRGRSPGAPGELRAAGVRVRSVMRPFHAALWRLSVRLDRVLVGCPGCIVPPGSSEGPRHSSGRHR